MTRFLDNIFVPNNSPTSPQHLPNCIIFSGFLDKWSLCKECKNQSTLKDAVQSSSAAKFHCYCAGGLGACKRAVCIVVYLHNIRPWAAAPWCREVVRTGWRWSVCRSRRWSVEPCVPGVPASASAMEDRCLTPSALSPDLQQPQTLTVKSASVYIVLTRFWGQHQNGLQLTLWRIAIRAEYTCQQYRPTEANWRHDLDPRPWNLTTSSFASTTSYQLHDNHQTQDW